MVTKNHRLKVTTTTFVSSSTTQFLSLVTRSTTASKTGTTSKSTLGRNKTDTGVKKPTKPTKPSTTKSKLTSTDSKHVPSYMRPTKSSMAAHSDKGSIGPEEQAPTSTTTKKKGTTTKPSTVSKHKIGGTKPTRPKKPKADAAKIKEKKETLEPAVDALTPDQVSTEPVDASATVGIAPTTPPTPGHDPVPHSSDNESSGSSPFKHKSCKATGGVCVEVKEAHEVESEAKQAPVLFQEALVDVKEDPKAEETEEVEETETEAVVEANMQTVRDLDAADCEEFATTEAVVETNDTEEETEVTNEEPTTVEVEVEQDQQQQDEEKDEQNEDPLTNDPVLNQTGDPPVTTEALETEEVSEGQTVVTEVDPSAEATVEVEETAVEAVQQTTTVEAPEERSLEENPEIEDGAVLEDSAPIDTHQAVTNPEEANVVTTEQTLEQDEETKVEAMNSEQAVGVIEETIELGTDPQQEEEEDEVTEEVMEVEQDTTQTALNQSEESEKQHEDSVPVVAPKDEQKHCTAEGSTTSEHKTNVTEASTLSTKAPSKSAPKGKGRKHK
eukprot:g7077.t2